MMLGIGSADIVTMVDKDSEMIKEFGDSKENGIAINIRKWYHRQIQEHEYMET